MATKTDVLIQLLLLVNDDKIAISYQSLGQYRLMLKQRIAELLENEPPDNPAPIPNYSEQP